MVWVQWYAEWAGCSHAEVHLFSVLQHIVVSSPKAMGRLPKRQGGKLEEWLLAISFWSIQAKNQLCMWRKRGGLCWLLFKRLSPFFSLLQQGVVTSFPFYIPLPRHQPTLYLKLSQRTGSISLPWPQYLNPPSLCSLTFCFPLLSLFHLLLGKICALWNRGWAWAERRESI